MSTETQPGTRGEQADGQAPEQGMLTVTDSRTGRTYELPITDGTVRAMDLRQIKVDDGDFGLMTYDPAYMNTASTRSSITYIAAIRSSSSASTPATSRSPIS
jgi:citrate synthase